MTALITVMSVMNGFQRNQDAHSRRLHVQVSGNMQDVVASVAGETLRHPEVDVLPRSAQGMVSYGQIVSGVAVRGILPEMENDVADFSGMMVDGELSDLVPGGFGMVIGRELARALGVFTGDKIVLISPQGQVTPAGILPRLKQFTITGIFQAGHFEYDSTLALIHMSDAQKLYRMGEDEVSGIGSSCAISSMRHRSFANLLQ